MMLTAAQIDRHIEILRDLDRNDLADTLAAYIELAERIAEEGQVAPGESAGLVPFEILENARRLRGVGTSAAPS
jgi:hypothetical protein